MTTAYQGANFGIILGWANAENAWDTSPVGARDSIAGMDGNLAMFDALTYLDVINATTTAPPGSPTVGDRYIVGTGATGAWAGKDGKIASRQPAGWVYYTPQKGWIATEITNKIRHVYTGSTWISDLSFCLDSSVAYTAGQFVQWNNSTGLFQPHTLGSGDITAALGFTPLNKAGDTTTGAIVINLNAAAAPTPVSGAGLQVSGLDTTATSVEIDTFGMGSTFRGVRWDGTNASPAAVASGMVLASLSARAYDGTSVAGPLADVQLNTAQLMASGAHGTYISLRVTAIGTTTIAESMRLENDGGITIPPTVTGGDKGAGAVNATKLYQAGNQVVDSSGGVNITGNWAATANVSVHNATNLSVNSATGALAVFGLTTLQQWSADNLGARIYSFKSRQGTIGGASTAVASGDALLDFRAYADDGSSNQYLASRTIYSADAAPIAGTAAQGRFSVFTSTSAGTNTEALRIDSSQLVRVFLNGSATAPSLVLAGTNTNAGFYGNNGNSVGCVTNGVGAWIVDSSQRLTVGNTSNLTTNSGNSRLQSAVVNASLYSLTLQQYTADAIGTRIYTYKSRSTTTGTNTILVNNDVVFDIAAYGDDGASSSNNTIVARILMAVSGTPAAAAIPGMTRFFTSTSGGTSTEAMRLDASQNINAGASNIISDVNGILRARSYTLATLPTTGYVAGQHVYCSNLGGAAGLLVNNASAWRRADPLGGYATNSSATPTGNYVYLTDAPVKSFTGTLTANATITLSTTDGSAGANTVATGAYARIINKTTGAFTFSVTNGGAGAGTKAITSGQYIDYVFDGTNWNEVAGGTLP